MVSQYKNSQVVRIKNIMPNFLQAIARRFSRKPTPSTFQIPVLCYHSWTASGPDYLGNDHVALERDLKTLASLGYEIIPIPSLVRLLKGQEPIPDLAVRKLVGITFDDGMMYDYHSGALENGNDIKSFNTILRESQDIIAQATPGPRGVSFVIASPECRAVLGGPEQHFNDTWWQACAAEGVIGLANHSWDHVHEAMDNVRQQDNRKGSFFEIKSFEDAEAQIAEANAFIMERTGGRSLSVFGYPFGHVPDYLRDEYFPTHARRIGLSAAFSTAGTAVCETSNVWDIPRYVCGEHWKTPEDFSNLLTSLYQ